MKASTDLYTEDFYKDQVSGSYRSAGIYAQILSKVYVPASVADVGCGRGMWLKAFKELGATRLVGFDGDWNSQADMVDQEITYINCNLNDPQPPVDRAKFDLAISLEVAEHLHEHSAPKIVRFLSGLSDVVLFSAAYTGQGGTGHLNERPNTYWARLFAAHEMVPFDLFRAAVWGDQRVEYWYQQNAFLYVRQGSEGWARFAAKGVVPMANTAFMDCVHPALYATKIHEGFMDQLSMTRKAFVLAVQKRVKGMGSARAG